MLMKDIVKFVVSLVNILSYYSFEILIQYLLSAKYFFIHSFLRLLALHKLKYGGIRNGKFKNSSSWWTSCRCV
jgi:hypothetical protein